MSIFSKVDKEVLIILATVLILILLLSFAVYKNVIGSSARVQNYAGGVQTQ